MATRKWFCELRALLGVSQMRCLEAREPVILPSLNKPDEIRPAAAAPTPRSKNSLRGILLRLPPLSIRLKT